MIKSKGAKMAKYGKNEHFLFSKIASIQNLGWAFGTFCALKRAKWQNRVEMAENWQNKTLTKWKRIGNRQVKSAKMAVKDKNKNL